MREAQERGRITSSTTTGGENQHLRNAIDRLAEREATFTHADLMGALLAEGMGQMSVSTANEAIARNTRTHGLDLYEARIGERKAWTTPAASEQERRIEAQVEAGRGAVAPAVSRRAVRNALKDTTLNESQRAAVELLVSAPDQFVAVVGRPGTGKTTMVREARQLLESRGYTAIGMAPNGAAAKELEVVGGLVGSRSVASHLARMGKRASELRGLEGLARAEALEAHRKEVWIVDEASQVNNRDMRRLIHFATLTGARIAMIGDPAQLGAINAGKPFERLLKTGIRHVEMHEIFRQTQSQDRAVVQAAIDRDVARAFDLLEPHVRTIAKEEDRLSAMVGAWARSIDRESTLMIAMRTSSKAPLNDLARDW
jgi:ATP-dependent exoDNAse (exonuclease V) alpha subunit